ncbi:MAG TPA: hypothetical protein VLJ16_00875 [Acidobacteriota bacterium]|nr:hypothetical protein [Acidobacteriota bacterium]
MRCRINRWMISRAEDAGKVPPRFVERHTARCEACGEFSRAAASISSRLRAERRAWLAKVPDFPIDLTRGPELSPAASPASGPRPSASPHSRSFLRPLPVAASALAILAAGLILFQVYLRGPGPSAEDRLAARAAIDRLTSAPQTLPAAVGEAESALERERRILEESVASAAEYLQARLNIRIERREPRAKST